MTDSGTLFVVATPLGHLGDLSLRAVEILRGVPVVAAEDTRRSRQLLTHVGASPQLLSFHAHSDPGRLETLLGILAEGRDVALVSDAGTPGISDPGAVLVRAVREAGMRVVPIPGPSAVATALSASGLPADRFLFLGFLPRKGPERERLLRQAADSEWTVVLYEAPHRLTDLLGDLGAAAGPDRYVVVGRELTKMHEEFRAGPLSDLLGHWSGVEVRGECTVVVEGRGHVEPNSADQTDAGRALATALLAEGHSRKDVVRMLTDQLQLSRNLAYRLVMEQS
jgi:16S rRNA (cytidine1402-2'-O)-methyltransferase